MDVGRNNHIRVINNGIGGQTSTDLAARIATMVVNMKPKYCFLEIGVNDSGGALATYQANMGTIVDAINAAGIKPVIFEIAPLGGLPAGQITWVANANAWLPGFAASKGAIMIYCFSVLNNPADSGHPLPTYMADDGIHLSAAGYQFMASQVRNLI
jgi:lysophospholipase L1-like esterase